MAEIKLNTRQLEALQKAHIELGENPNKPVKIDIGDTEVRAFTTRGMRTTIIHNKTNAQNPETQQDKA